MVQKIRAHVPAAARGVASDAERSGAAREATDGSPSRRVAVVAVHGVADQALGDTARALADLLIAQAPNDCRYEAGIRRDETLQVGPLEPIFPGAKTAQGFRKQFRQSAGSDFLRAGKNAEQPKSALPVHGTSLSLGVQFSDYLLSKAMQNNAATETYTMPLISLRRTRDGAAHSVDIHEMYWADLSRLSGAVPRILTELFTLLFRLSSLGRDTVQMQAAATGFTDDRRWRTLQWTQTALDWMYSRVFALLFLQLGMLALLLVPFGLGLAHAPAIHKVASAVAAIALGAWLLYAYRSLVLAIAAGGALGAAMWLLSGAWIVGLTWIALLCLFYDWWMRVCEQRFRMVRVVGWTLWLITIASTIAFAANAPSTDLAMWITGSLRALEVVLLMIVAWWACAGPLMVVWLIASVAGARVGPVDDRAMGRRVQARSSLGTGRLGLFISLGFFVILAMTAWALVTTAVERSVDHLQYAALIFEPHPVAGDATHPGATTSAAFLDERFVKSTASFSAIALLLFPLVAYLALMMLPSVLAELEVLVRRAQPLGRWLTGGYRYLDRIVAVMVVVGVLLALAIGVILVLYRFGIEVSMSWVSDPSHFISANSDKWLKFFVVSAGTATLALSAVGGLLSRYVPWLRAPLDAALDVDNHFREFPRKAIPRARIFARYVAVLNRIAAHGYDRIVIVSHSQGTVISAELLRYMKERAAHAPSSPASDRIAELWGRLTGRVGLLTAGCPLRQLYAARFPVLYEWVLQEHGETLGPLARDVGVNRWVNVYATGDYVGRWLWSRCARDEYPVSQIDQTAEGGSTYTQHNDASPAAAALAAGDTEIDLSIGAGAHTHYFNIDQKLMAGIVDALVAP